MSEKRFPPPRNEAGYRDAAPPLEVDEPTAPEAARTHVVATRPDDPDVARRKAAREDPAIREQDARVAAREAEARRATWMGLLFAAILIALRIFACGSRHRLP